MRRAVIVLLSITAAFGPDKLSAVDKKGAFRVEAATAYPGHVTQEKITVAAKPYNTTELAAEAFGKVKPHEHGILPVLVVIKNDTGKALSLELAAQFVAADGDHGEAMPPFDVQRYQGIQKRPGMKAPTAPLPIPRKKAKGPLNVPEIEGRAFSVKLVPPGESVSGFFYFEATDVKGAHLYLTGINDAASNQPYFYFEVPLDAK
ncbi:MAG: hypothetical protein WDO18_05120 [Acidobacteriota bacterium]